MRAMPTRPAIALAALTATVVMAGAVTTASANRISISNKQFRIMWSALEFWWDEPEGDISSCPVTFEGSFHSATIRKVQAAVGLITRVREGSCEELLFITVFNKELLPWTVWYQSFSGRLPSITAIRVLIEMTSFSFISKAQSYECLFHQANEVSLSGELLNAGAVLAHFEWDTATWVPRINEPGAFCPARAGLKGLGEVYVLNSTSRISIRLI